MSDVVVKLMVEQRKRLVARAAQLGYDVTKLEFPEQPRR